MPSAFSVMVGLLPEPQTLCLPVGLGEKLEHLTWEHMSNKSMQVQEPCSVCLMTLELLLHLNPVLTLFSLRMQSEMGVWSSAGFLLDRIIIYLTKSRPSVGLC